jgi:hypothetical protein
VVPVSAIASMSTLLKTPPEPTAKPEAVNPQKPFEESTGT